MFVIKRDGRRVPIRYDTITDRNIELSKDLDINVEYLSKLVIQSVKDNMTTSEIDELSAETAAYMSTYEPDYDILASRICVSNHHKSTSDSFSETMTRLHSEEKILSDEFIQFVNKHHVVLNNAIDYKKDFNYTYFGFKTLCKLYLLKCSGKIIERPQHMLMRVAVQIYMGNIQKGIEGSIKDVISTYIEMSEGKFTHASPTLFNSGLKRPQLASCFLLSSDDDLTHIYETNKRCALISKFGGGIGVDISRVRAKGSKIASNGGKSDGIVPMIQVFNSTARYCNQQSKRKGSFAMYLQPWHPDIFDFLVLRNNTPPEELRARDIFLAVWVPDLFMKRVESDDVWSLFCPSRVPLLNETYGDEFETIYIEAEKNKLFNKQVKARDVWKAILDAQIETGLPYVVYKDSVNRKNNQSNLGIIRCSNLCVSGDTKILTKEGHIDIINLVNKETEIWNGFEWSKVIPKKTGENQPLLEVELSNGIKIKCTEYHKFPIVKSYQHKPLEKVKYELIEAKDLKFGQKLLKYRLPILEGNKIYDMKYPYTSGMFTGDGTYETNNKPRLSLYHKKIDLLPYIEKRLEPLVDKDRTKIDVRLPLDIPAKYTVPHDLSTIDCKLKWFAGLCDSDGCVVKNNKTLGIQVSSIYKDFLVKIKNMLQTISVDSKISVVRQETDRLMPDGKGSTKLFHCQTCYRLLINTNDLEMLLRLGFETHRLDFSDFNCPDRSASKFITIINVKPLDGLHDTYCFTEEKRNLGMFNGVLLGNCAEILEYTDNDHTSVCNLCSMALPKFVYTVNKQKMFDWDELGRITRMCVRNLNSVIDNSFYPIKEAETTNLKTRPLGIGIQGLYDVFVLFKAEWGDELSTLLNRVIFEVIYYNAVLESHNLAMKTGSYQSFEGSPISKGILQPDMWNVTPLTNKPPINNLNIPHLDWEGLRQKCKLGVKNSLLIALMPTASSSQILNNTEAMEVVTSNIYSRSTLAGNFMIVNKHLYRDLKEINLWNKNIVNKIIENDGSIQTIKEIPTQLKSIYKTVWEVSQKKVIDLAADRAPFIDQTQSMNIFMEHPTHAKLSSMHMYGWKQGLKTGSYYIRSKPAKEALKFTLLTESSSVTEKNTTTVEKEGKRFIKDGKEMICTDEVCIMCQG